MHTVEAARVFTAKAMEFSFLAMQAEPAENADLLRKIISPNPGKSPRLDAVVRLARNIHPGLTEAVVDSFINVSLLPVSGDITYFSRGGENSVFRFQGDGKEMLLKINRHTISMSVDELQQRAQATRDAYVFVREKFQSVPGFVPPEQTLILHSHIKGWAAVATLQEEVRGVDFFDGASRERLVEEMKANDEFSKEVKKVTRLIGTMYEEGRVIDLLGARNLLIRESGESRLVFVDSHLMHSLAEVPGEKRVRLEKRIAYMEEILREAA